MKTFRITGLTILAFLLLLSCSKDDDGVAPVVPATISLPDDISVSENAGAKEILINFSKASPENGIISIQITSETEGGYTTEPATTAGVVELDVQKGDEAASFNIIPDDNDLLDGDRTVTIELLDSTEGFQIGERNRMTITITDDEVPATVSFVKGSDSIRENEPEGLEVQLQLSGPAPGDGNVLLQLEGVDEEVFTTDPPLENDGSLTIPVTAGDSQISFRILPMDNDILTSHHTVMIFLEEASEVLQKGEQLSTEITILDDELEGKPKSMETSGPNETNKKTWEYNPQGKISQVHVENDGKTTTHTYHYNEQDRLLKISEKEGKERHFSWQNDRITRSEYFEDGVRVSFSEYDYDVDGNIAVRSEYRLQNSGQFALRQVDLFVYHDDGNLRRQVNYDVNASGATSLNTTYTYNTYLDATNLFPTHEIIPGRTTQFNLPASLEIEKDGTSTTYTYAYEFNDNGYAISRSSNGEEVIYTYY